MTTTTSAIEELLKNANAGNEEAQNELGNMYLEGRGVAKDEKTAFEWFQKAAADRLIAGVGGRMPFNSSGSKRAQYNLGNMYRDGRGVTKDNKLACEWYMKAATRGHTDAQYNFGNMYRDGHGITKDDKLACEWYQKAAAQGHKGAQYNFGNIYRDGLGFVAKNENAACEWYQKAAEQGHKEAYYQLETMANNDNASAQYRLGNMYREGRGVDKDDKTACKWYQKAAEQGHKEAKSEVENMAKKGIVAAQEVLKILSSQIGELLKKANAGQMAAQITLGEMYETGKEVRKDIQLACEWFKKAEKQGSALAFSKLSELAKRGVVFAMDEKSAFEWYEKTAEQGDMNAQYDLGNRYLNSKGMLRDEELALKWYRKAAEQGHAGAQFRFGLMHENGLGVENNYKTACRWYREAAEQGWASAQFKLGEMYERVHKNFEAAHEWYQRAAAQGDVEAQCNLGVAYAEGRGVTKDEKTACEWLQKAAEKGYADAQCNLGLMYVNGQGVKQDDKTACEWFQKAAEQGNALAQYTLGYAYEIGQGVKEDDKIACKWYRQAAEQNNPDALIQLEAMAEKGSMNAQCAIGVLYANGQGVTKDEKTACEWLKKAAALDDKIAQCLLVMMSENIQGVVKNETTACERYQKAATLGDKEAQCTLGILYEVGRVVAKDEKIACKWYQKAAEQGNATAQYKLGLMHANGRGVPKDIKIAFGWYQKAAALGGKEAQFTLGILYEKGQGIIKDQKSACYWYQKAAAQGHGTAKFQLENMADKGIMVAQEALEALLLNVDSNTSTQSTTSASKATHFEHKEDNETEIQKLLKKATEGDIVAQYALGVAYTTGNGVAKDEKVACEWFQKAAELGYIDAQYALGVVYTNGQGTPKDEKLAFKWYEKAAIQGDTMAQYAVGEAYANGQGVAKNEKSAIVWYQKAEKKEPDAQYALGNAYEKGLGVSKDKKIACEWYKKAAAQGHKGAQSQLEDVMQQEVAGTKIVLSPGLLVALISSAQNAVLITGERGIEIKNIEINPRNGAALIYQFYSKGSDSDRVFLDSLKLTSQDSEKNTALHYGVLAHDGECLKRLVKNQSALNINLDSVNLKQESALDLACMEAKPATRNQMVSVLLKAGAQYVQEKNIAKINAICETILEVIEDDKLKDAVQNLKPHSVLIKASDISSKSDADVISQSSTQSEMMVALVSAARNPVLTIGEGGMEISNIEINPQMIAELTYKFYSKGTDSDRVVFDSLKLDLNAQDCEKNTALHYAILAHDGECLKRLVKKQIALDSTNLQQESALDLVCMEAKPATRNQMVSVLLKAGAQLVQEKNIARINGICEAILEVMEDDKLKSSVQKLKPHNSNTRPKESSPKSDADTPTARSIESDLSLGGLGNEDLGQAWALQRQVDARLERKGDSKENAESAHLAMSYQYGQHLKGTTSLFAHKPQYVKLQKEKP